VIWLSKITFYSALESVEEIILEALTCFWIDMICFRIQTTILISIWSYRATLRVW